MYAHVSKSPLHMLGPYILAGLSALGWAYTEFVHSDKDITARVSVLESQRHDDHDTINEIKETVHDLDSKLDQLLQRH